VKTPILGIFRWSGVVFDTRFQRDFFKKTAILHSIPISTALTTQVVCPLLHLRTSAV
jgi:hypothetical protein